MTVVLDVELDAAPLDDVEFHLDLCRFVVGRGVEEFAVAGVVALECYRDGDLGAVDKLPQPFGIDPGIDAFGDFVDLARGVHGDVESHDVVPSRGECRAGLHRNGEFADDLTGEVERVGGIGGSFGIEVVDEHVDDIAADVDAVDLVVQGLYLQVGGEVFGEVPAEFAEYLGRFVGISESLLEEVGARCRDSEHLCEVGGIIFDDESGDFIELPGVGVHLGDQVVEECSVVVGVVDAREVEVIETFR